MSPDAYVGYGIVAACLVLLAITALRPRRRPYLWELPEYDDWLADQPAEVVPGEHTAIYDRLICEAMEQQFKEAS